MRNYIQGSTLLVLSKPRDAMSHQKRKHMHEPVRFRKPAEIVDLMAVENLIEFLNGDDHERTYGVRAFIFVPVKS